jgi:hypothetical protein
VTTWRTPELDDAAARALAVVTLYASGADADAALAARLLEQLTAEPDGVAAVVGGLVSVCSGLLVLLEYEAGCAPEGSLQQLGRLVAEATVYAEH